jgi:GR25 family glycosyltransferase involved in LPS biosynthesis
LDAFIISLLNSSRREKASANALVAGLIPIFFDAVDASTLKIEKSSLIRSNELFCLRYGRPHAIVELATLLSHRKLYDHLLNNNNANYYLILEDDFIPLANSNIINQITAKMCDHNFDVAILGYPRCDDVGEKKINQSNPIKLPIEILEGSNIFIGERCIETTSGCLSYIVSKSFLNKVTKLESNGYLADDWDFYSKCGIKIAHVMPSIFRENYKNMPSTMSLTRSLVLRESAYKKISPFIPECISQLIRLGVGKYRLIKYKNQ